MLEMKYYTPPIYGYTPKERTKFCDRELFGDELWKYAILKKIKLCYGTPKSGDEKIKDKIILGIQCVYQDTITGSKIATKHHCGDLSSEDVETNEYELKENDYFTKFNIDFEYAITHLKFTTRSGDFIELGKEREDTKKHIEFNTDKEPHMIHSFIGCYNIYGLRALGCKHIYRKDYVLIRYMGILRLRHIFKIDENERKKWEVPETLNKLPLEMRAIAKLCALPDDIFEKVIRISLRINI